VLHWLLRRNTPAVTMVRTWSTAVLFQGRGTKAPGALASACA
jgi:hypothetical protein